MFVLCLPVVLGDQLLVLLGEPRVAVEVLLERMSDFQTAIQRLRLWAHWRVWLLVQRQMPLEILVDASSRARVWADGGWFGRLRLWAFVLGDSVNGQALLERGFAVAWRWLVGVCTFRTLSLFSIVSAPCVVFLGAGRATSLPLDCCLAAAAQALFLGSCRVRAGFLVRGRISSGSSELIFGVGRVSYVWGFAWV